jgi:hypothetical protein
MAKNYRVSAPTTVSARVRKNGKPDLPKWLFWDTRYETLDWMAAYRGVIERVLDRGEDEDWEALIRYYGRDRVLKTLTQDEIYLMDHSIERACAYFKLKPEELRCYIRKQSRGGHWH